jgi:hypothetical protein
VPLVHMGEVNLTDGCIIAEMIARIWVVARWSLLSLCLTAARGQSISDKQESTEGSLRQTIQVNVDHLDTLLTKTNAPVLFLDGREIKGVSGILHNPPDASGNGALFFQLERTAENRNVWQPILSRPTFSPRRVRLSVGVPGQTPISSNFDFQLRVLHGSWFGAWVGLLAVLIVPFFFKGGRDLLLNVLREAGPVPVGQTAAYSLSRCQMAFWFVIVVLAYIFLYMVTWDYDTITTGTLTLIGISAGTAFAGAIVDTGKNSSMAAEKSQLTNELNAAPPPNAARAAEITARINAIDTQMATPIHVNWMSDLLEDANGMSFHRIQMLVWSIILVIIFVITVYNDLLMADFSGTLLGLMGISSGTYVGFKFPENKN